MEKLIKTFNPPFLIVGMAKSGHSARELLLECGISKNDLFTYDDVPGRADFSVPQEALSIQPRTIIVAPGYPLQRHWLQEAKSRGTTLISEIDLAQCFITDEIVIGVTGSVGKSTTVSLIGSGLKEIDSKCFVGGNLGVPFCEYARAILKNPQEKAKFVVLELSSFQLENSQSLVLDYSVITYFSGNHLERYSSINDYYQTKWNMLLQTRYVCFLNQGSVDLNQWANQHPDSKARSILAMKVASQVPKLNQHQLVGNHNLENIALAYSVLSEINAPDAAIEKMLQFKGLAHRLERVLETQNLVCINDSKATAIDSVITAVKSTLETYPQCALTVLVGGKDKNLPWEQLSQISADVGPNLEIHFFGECGQLAQNKSQLPGDRSPTLRAALLQLSARLSKNKKSVLLLSPGGSSFDEFSGFEDRGNFFRNFCLDAFKNHSAK